MELKDGFTRVRHIWLSIVEEAFHCPARVDESLTQEFEWGWVIFLVPTDPAECRSRQMKYRFAYDRTAEVSIPVGTKGLSFAVRELMGIRERIEKGELVKRKPNGEKEGRNP